MLDFLKARRSIRCYEDKEVEREKIDKILKSALLSPSSKARKPWEFIVVTNKAMLRVLSKCRTVGGGPFIANSSVAIVVLADTEKSDVWIEDVSIAATLIHLEAHKLGLGCCWVQVRKRSHDENKTADEYVRENLNIPKKYAVECIMSIGYKGEDRPPYEDKDLELSKIHYEVF